MDRHHSLTPLSLASFETGLRCVVIGAKGGIGRALAEALDSCPTVDRVYRLARRSQSCIDYLLDLEDEESIRSAAEALRQEEGTVDLIIVASGLLHRSEDLQPEKTWRSLSSENFEAAFRVNTIGPALVAKHFLPLLGRERKSVFAALSARVGSIADNELGGWYSYRASKAALNMVIRTLSIELARRNPDAFCVGLHPGTVDTELSKPFQRGVLPQKLFTPEVSARHLLEVLDTLKPGASGRLFAWDGKAIPY